MYIYVKHLGLFSHGCRYCGGSKSKKQGFVKGEELCFRYCDFIFQRSRASQTSWREYF